MRRFGLRLEEDNYEAHAVRLRALVGECVTTGVPRRALLLRLSQLPEDLARPHHLRLARSALDPLTMADRARLFHLPNGDLVVVWRGEAAAALKTTLDSVLHLFADADELPDPGILVQPLTLPEQAGALLQAIDESLRPAPGLEGAAEPVLPLDLVTLGLLEGALAQADMSRFMRQRDICERVADGSFRLGWRERRLSAAEIASVLVPDRDVRREPWLFRRLTRTLDKRMLSLLAAPGELRQTGPFGIGLNVAAVLSAEFLRFDAALPASLRGRVVLGLMPADIMADPGAFQFARDFARARGYRLALHGVGAELLKLFRPDRLGLDFLQIRFSRELMQSAALPDPATIVLTRAHHVGALEWGQAAGITLFEGRAVMAAERVAARIG
jgi:hypothetical protein